MNARKATDLAFSICIPCYNGRDFLRETLESVRAQTHPNWELILVEDASPEPCKDIVEEFSASVSQQVHYFENEQNLGVAKTRDKGFGHASHDYIAPLDADDIWKPNHLEEMARVLKESGKQFVFCSYLAFREHTDNIEIEYSPAPELLNQLRLAYFYAKFWLQPSSLAFERRIFDQIGPWSQGLELKPKDLPGHRYYAEDRNFFLRVFLHGIEPVWTRSATTYYRQHDNSILGQEYYYSIHRVWLINLHGHLSGFPIWPQRKYFAYANANAGRFLKQHPEHRKWAARFYLKAWLWYPLRVDRLFQSLRAILTGK